MRKDKGLTQGEVARMAGVSRQLVNRLEVGTATGIALDKLMAILATVGCSLWVEDDNSSPDARASAQEEPSGNDAYGEAAEEFMRRYAMDATLFAPGMERTGTHA